MKRTRKYLELGLRTFIQGMPDLVILHTTHIQYISRCACDIPAHMYTYSFEPNPKYKHVYAGNAEIYEYFNEFADKYGLRKYIKVNHEIIGTRWDDAEGHWLVDIKNTVTGEIIHDTGHFFINASGVLNAWKWPNIPGLHDFKGELLHTARWDKNIDLTGKHVGLIGNGSLFFKQIYFGSHSYMHL